MKHILGIDPGLDGALAIVDVDTLQLVEVLRMPIRVVHKQRKLDGAALAEWLQRADDCVGAQTIQHAYIEEVHSRPRQAGVFDFGLNTGILHGMLYATGIPFSLVSPQQRKGHYGIRRVGDETKADKKTEARQIATQLFPSHAKEFVRVKDDGVAEAALIARYGAVLQGGK